MHAPFLCLAFSLNPIYVIWVHLISRLVRRFHSICQGGRRVGTERCRRAISEVLIECKCALELAKIKVMQLIAKHSERESTVDLLSCSFKHHHRAYPGPSDLPSLLGEARPPKYKRQESILHRVRLDISITHQDLWTFLASLLLLWIRERITALIF